ncbi:TatD family hydrolase [Thiosulfatimonas sediminis]|uniref:TatD family hydrolase n=1 Tax=Thiosulfatimonas sediminis TaxID=2675054 RepID=A0A6F8PXI1_9GAMM|nr:TatD family hydrolase [Thiosulfatimonas sediminis]BBP46829.1 TatD family hydrolase [Thiosulfatimonas sediminis]
MLFDTHAHLLEANQEQLAALTYPVLNVTSHLAQWQDAIRLSEQNPLIGCALGIHPWFVNETSFSDLTYLLQLLEWQEIAAIGEVGLDFQPAFQHTKERQLAIFESQLQLAVYFNKPVSIHVIKAHNEMLSLLKSYSVCGVIHGLGASLSLAKRYLDLDFKIGLNGVLCRQNARRYREMVAHFDLAHFVLETDYPNVVLPTEESADLADLFAIANCVAFIKNVSVTEVVEQTRYNAHSIFSFTDIGR